MRGAYPRFELRVRRALLGGLGAFANRRVGFLMLGGGADDLSAADADATAGIGWVGQVGRCQVEISMGCRYLTIRVERDWARDAETLTIRRIGALCAVRVQF